MHMHQFGSLSSAHLVSQPAASLLYHNHCRCPLFWVKAIRGAFHTGASSLHRQAQREQAFWDMYWAAWVCKSAQSFIVLSCRLVHRLDRGTSGALILARSRGAATRLSRAFRQASASLADACAAAEPDEAKEIAGDWHSLIITMGH